MMKQVLSLRIPVQHALLTGYVDASVYADAHDWDSRAIGTESGALVQTYLGFEGMRGGNSVSFIFDRTDYDTISSLLARLDREVLSFVASELQSLEIWDFNADGMDEVAPC